MISIDVHVSASGQICFQYRTGAVSVYSENGLGHINVNQLLL